VCESCRSMLVRVDDYTQNLGQKADMPDDNSPVQLGTQGTYEGRAFELIGRLKIRYERGVWNEWYAWFTDQQHGWLAEAQGFWMMSFPEPHYTRFPAVDDLKIGQKRQLAGDEYLVADLRQIHYGGAEGELPFSATEDYTSTVVDLAAKGGRFATLDYPDQGEPRAYLGRYVDFDELKLKNLSALAGWKF